MGAALLALALAIGNLLSLVGLAPRAAHAAPDTVTMTGWSGDGDVGYFVFEAGSAGFAICANARVTDPSVGDVFGGATPITECSASMLSGVDPYSYAYAAAHMPLGGSVDTYGFTGSEAERGAATFVANVLLQGGSVDERGRLHWKDGELVSTNDIYTSKSANRVLSGELPKIERLVSDALAHAGQSGWWDDSATYWRNQTSSAHQNIITFNPVTPTGDIELQKASELPELTEGNDLYGLGGAVYGVYSDESCDESALVTTVTTNDEGKASAEGLAPATYYLKEITPPQGHAKDEGVYPVEVESGTTVRAECTDVPQTNPIDLVVAKVDGESGTATPQGDATLAGAEFTLSYYAGSYDSVDALPQEPTRTWVLATGDDGRAFLDEDHLVSGDAFYRSADGAVALPLGTVTVQETKPPAGYTLSDASVRLQQIVPTGELETVDSYVAPTFEEHVIRGGVELRKIDHERAAAGAEDAGLALGSATLEGAVIEVTNVSEKSVTVGDKTVAPGEVALTLRTLEDGSSASEPDALPYGTYTAREAEPPAGYLLNEDWSVTFSIERDGQIARPCEEEPLEDQVIRGDVNFTKAEEGTQERMAGIPFKMTSLSTGEWHVLVADENGMVDTSAAWLSHEGNTNASDAALREDGTVDESALRDDAGVWFYGRDDEATLPTDELGALPYDTYRIEELPCSANAGHLLVSTLVTISRNEVDLDLGTMDDETVPEMTMESELTRAGSKVAPAQEGVTLTDAVRFEGATRRTEYRVVGELRAFDASGAALGAVAQAEESFVPELSSGDVELVYENVDLSELAGARLVSCVRAYDGEQLVASHVDLADEDQTVRVPGVRTTLLSDATAAHDAPSYASSCVTDTVSVQGLVAGKRYELEGTLRTVELGEDGEKIAGAEVARSSTSFVAESEQMELQLSFEVDGTELAGATLNASEVLLADGEVVAAHDDAADEDQTLWLPALASQAHGKATESQASPTEGEQVLVDTVSVSNLLVGEQYVLRSSAHAKDVLEDGTSVDGGMLAGATAETSFTATESCMTLEVEIPYDASELEGRDVVAFEELYRADVLLAAHADVDDAGQTLVVPSVRTTASAGEDGSRELLAAGEQRALDRVELDGLLPGTTYELTASLHLRGTAEDGSSVDLGPVTGADGTPVSASTSFVAEGDTAVVDISLPFDASALDGEADVVVFEELRSGDVVLARHADIADKDQTLEVVVPPTEPPATPPSFDLPSTGEALSFAGAFGIAGATLVAAAAGQRHWRKRRRQPRVGQRLRR